MKSFVLAVALLLPVSTAFAQAPAPEAAPEAAPAPAAAAKPPVVRAAKPRPKPVAPVAPVAAAHAPRLSPTGQEVMEVNQIVGIRQVDPATYEVDAVLENGTPIDLRMNAFVMQDLGRKLGTYGQH